MVPVFLGGYSPPMQRGNPLIDDAFVDFLLHDVLELEELLELPTFEHHSRQTFDLFLESVRRFSRKQLWPTYKAMDEAPPIFTGGQIETHEALPRLWKQMVELGVLDATRRADAGGADLPLTLYSLASAYLMAGNPSVYGYAGLTIGATHLLEAFGDETVKARFLEPMTEGTWTGTMALTEPQAGSSLGDITTTATPTDSDHYLIRGSKIFISGGDHRATENIVHLTLARIAGAPDGSAGISLFAIPTRRREGDELIDNDVTVAGMIHKIGWRGLPSLALEFGDREDCRGYLVGEPNRGLKHMFQMMNEARIMVGVNGAATASVGYHESLNYALERKQGRASDKRGEPVPIIEHADVRRMLLRQKAVVEGSLAMLATVSRYSDVAEHDPDAERSQSARALLNLLTPIAKTFPAESGFESNALALQIHGGYGYSSEYVVESLLRDQKLNSLHEGTTGIQSLDLLGRKALGDGGAALALLAAEIERAIGRAASVGVDEGWSRALSDSMAVVASVTEALGKRGASGDVTGMLAHSVDYLNMLATVVIGWQWLVLATAATRKLADAESDRHRGTLACAQYWIATELPHVAILGERCRACERSYVDARPEWF